MIDFLGIKKEGPGVSVDTPRKKGIGRFFEILGRDFGSMYGSALIASIALIPGMFGSYISVMTASLLLAVLVGAICGMIFSPFYAVLVDTILRAQRDEPGYWWVRYRKAFANNWKASLLPGAIFGVLLNVQILCIFVILPTNLSMMMVASCTLSLLFTSFLIIWVYPQITLFTLPLGKILRNAAILGFSQLPRTFAATFLVVSYWVAAILFFPLSFLVFLLTSTWFPTFIALSFIYVPMEKIFDIERLMEEKRIETAAQQPRYYSKEGR